MADIIQLLPDHVANQIAAGEVVERPSSVVKELFENAIDAKASEIVLELAHGGKEMIRMRDNGQGLVKEDLPMAILAHATSKIASLKDLEAIASMGFRGEALASIASISKLKITSKTAASDMAWSVDQTGALHEASHNQGTTVEVCELFYNTPARRKFLKSEKTEYQHIDDLIKKFLLSHFDMSFRLIHNKKEIKYAKNAIIKAPAPISTK